jgi:UDP-N-acetylmuramoyl-tripeptide--D-alanyl-D-alanine ligase
MAELPLAALAGHMGGRYTGPPGRTADRAVIDSRVAGPGSLFFALAGERTDGHRYAGEVLDAGGAVVVSRDPGRGPRILVSSVEEALLKAGDWARDRISAPVIGLSGSSGKTTTRRLLELALATRFRVAATEGNRNNQLGLPLTLLNLPEDPEVVVLELGMNHAGELRLLCGVARPTDSVITNIGLAHVEYLGSREGVARAKAELLEGTASGGFCVIPQGEEILDRAAERAGLEAVRVGPGGDRWLERSPEGTLIQPGGHRLELAIPGRHNLDNALVAVTAAELMGVPPPAAVEAMGGYRGMAGRSEMLQIGRFRVMDESYNSNPDSAEACLRALAEVAEGGGVAVLGDMLELGERAEDLHRRVLDFADGLGLRRIVLVGAVFGSLADGKRATEILAAEDCRQAAEMAAEALEPGDTVLVKGSRGLRLERTVDLLRRMLPAPEGGTGR